MTILQVYWILGLPDQDMIFYYLCAVGDCKDTVPIPAGADGNTDTEGTLICWTRQTYQLILANLGSVRSAYNDVGESASTGHHHHGMLYVGGR